MVAAQDEDRTRRDTPNYGTRRRAYVHNDKRWSVYILQVLYRTRTMYTWQNRTEYSHKVKQKT